MWDVREKCVELLNKNDHHLEKSDWNPFQNKLSRHFTKKFENIEFLSDFECLSFFFQWQRFHNQSKLTELDEALSLSAARVPQVLGRYPLDSLFRVTRTLSVFECAQLSSATNFFVSRAKSLQRRAQNFRVLSSALDTIPTVLHCSHTTILKKCISSFPESSQNFSTSECFGSFYQIAS